VILGALRQTLPRDRELSAWEPQKLHARHISMVCDRAAGLLPREIAAKYKMHQVYVNVILTHPDSLQILAALQALNADKLMDVNARLQGYANEMLSGQVEVFPYHSRQTSQGPNRPRCLGSCWLRTSTKDRHKCSTPLRAANSGCYEDCCAPCRKISVSQK
jgi:hypothetical protein